MAMSRMRGAARAVVRALALALAVAALAAPCPAAAAPAPADEGAPALVYDARAKRFSYRGVEGTDLFASFKDLMPGDVRLQGFRVEVVHADEPVTVYVRAAYDAAEYAGIEGLRVATQLGSSPLLVGTLGDAHGMESAVEAACFDGDGSAPVTVTLTVPTELGNGTAGGTHVLSWEFIAQHEGSGETVRVPSDSLPQTGDSSGAAIWLALLAGCALLAAGYALRRRSKR